MDLERKVFIYPVQGEPLKSDESLTVYRKIPLTQIVDLENAGAFHPEVLEYDGFDRIVMQIQQLDEEISRALKIDMTDSRDVTQLIEELFTAREEAVLHAQKALEQAKLAADKAEKTEQWALYAEDKVQEITDLQVECFISNDGQGQVTYEKDSHKLKIVLPFDNTGLNQPKLVLSDKIDLVRSDIGASAKAVSAVYSLQTKIQQDMAAAITALINSKLDKSAVSSTMDSDSEETVLSSLGAKMLNEKIINSKKVTLLEERTAIGNVTLTGVEVGKPIFILSSQPTVNSMAYAYMSCLSGSLDGIVPNSTITAMCLGLQSGNYSTNIACVIPTQDTVVFNISVMTIGYIVRFYQ